MASPLSTIKPGEYSTNSALAADVGKTVILSGSEYRLCKTSAAISAAGGKMVAAAKSTGGAYNFGSVNVSTTLNDYDVIGGIPISADTSFVNYINSTVTVPISAYVLVQFYGSGYVVANSTIVAPAVFGNSASSLAASVDSTVYAPGGIKGRVTNTAAAAAAGGVPLTCFWGA